MVVLICLNAVTMMVQTDRDSMMKETILFWFYFIFIIIFFIEFLLKIIALRKHYFTSGWNILDFVVLVVCIVGESVNFIIVVSLDCGLDKCLNQQLWWIVTDTQICFCVFISVNVFQKVFGDLKYTISLSK